jgi:quercetin dioxygenase-like cupin family protein
MTRRRAAYRLVMTDAYTFLPDLAAEAAAPGRGIHSQTLSNADGVELVLFAMADGEQLSEHTSAHPAIIHVLRGEGALRVAGDDHALAPGSWLRMAARTPHAITARGPLVFALYLLPAA